VIKAIIKEFRAAFGVILMAFTQVRAARERQKVLDRMQQNVETYRLPEDFEKYVDRVLYSVLRNRQDNGSLYLFMSNIQGRHSERVD
jgi:hypothetical protein